MTKKAVLVKKMLRAYKNNKNWEYSKFKGYPENTYFGYASFAEMKKAVLKEFTDFYGKGLKGLRMERI